MLAYITAHWPSILSVLSAVVVVAREVVKFTSSTKDDAIEAQVEAALKSLGLLKDDSAPPAPPAA